MTTTENHTPHNDKNAVDRAKDSVASAAETVKRTAAETREDASQKLHAAKDYSTETYNKARDYSRERYDAAREYGREGWDRTRTGATRTRERTAAEIEANPLIAAGIGLIAGAAIGFLLPRTRQENRMMGGLRDSLVDQADAAAKAARDAGEERVRELGIADQAKQHVNELKDQALEAAKAARDAAAEETGTR